MQSGQYTDTGTGLQYLRAGYYDPATGAFLTRDPLEAQTREAYGYVGGNPLNMIDQLGLCGWRDPWNCVDDAAEAVGGAATEVWDATGGKAVSFGNDLCFESWQEAATCTAVVAGTVSLGAGGVAVLGLGGGLAGTAGTVGTYATLTGTAAQLGLTLDDCSNGLDASCAVNGVSTLAGGASLGLGYRATRLTQLGLPSAASVSGGLALGSSIWSFTFGFPGLAYAVERGRGGRGGRRC